METITGNVKAWMTSHDDIRVLERSPDLLASSLGYTTGETDMTTHGWLPVGEATISISIVSQEKLILDQIEALRQMQVSARAEAEKKVNAFEQKIQSLLAIKHSA